MKPEEAEELINQHQEHLVDPSVAAPNAAQLALAHKVVRELDEKNEVYGSEWARARTKEAEYLDYARTAEARASALRGALIIAAGKEKADQVDPIVLSSKETGSDLTEHPVTKKPCTVAEREAALAELASK